MLRADEARVLLDSIKTDSIVGLRDRAMIAVMVYSFARVSAMIHMRVDDYYQNGKRWWIRLHEKGGKRHEVPAHHNLEAYLDAYLAAAGSSFHFEPSAQQAASCDGQQLRRTGLKDFWREKGFNFEVRMMGAVNVTGRDPALRRGSVWSYYYALHEISRV